MGPWFHVVCNKTFCHYALGANIMKYSTIIKIIDLLSFLTLLLMVSTGTFLKYTLPPRSGGAEVWELT